MGDDVRELRQSMVEFEDWLERLEGMILALADFTGAQAGVDLEAFRCQLAVAEAGVDAMGDGLGNRREGYQTIVDRLGVRLR